MVVPFKLSSKAFMVLAVIGVILSVVGAFVSDVWLASTQWLLVAAVLASFGVYLKLEE